MMRANDLVRCVFNGSTLEPDGNYAAAQLHDKLGAGEVVAVDLNPERSRKTHNHQFGFVRQAWLNLPEEHKDAPWAANEDHLRHHALIACGFCHTDMIALGAEDRATRLAEFLRNGDEREGRYSIVTTKGPVAYRITAESQKLKNMGRYRFQESKQAILEWLADLIGVKPEELAKMGKRDAA